MKSKRFLCCLVIAALVCVLFSACGKQPAKDAATDGMDTPTLAATPTSALSPSDEPTVEPSAALSPTVAPSSGTSPRLTSTPITSAKATPTAKPKATPTATKATATAKPTAIPAPTPIIAQPAVFPCSFPLGTTVSVDLTGNGTADTVQVEKVGDNPSFDDLELLLRINDQTLTLGPSWGFSDTFTILQLGGVRFVVISDFLFGTTHAYRCQFFTPDRDGKILQSGHVVSVFAPKDAGFTPGGNTLQLWIDTTLLQQWAVRITYALTDDLRLVAAPPVDGLYQTCIPTYWLYGSSPKPVVTRVPLTLFESRDITSALVILGVDETITLGETDNKEWVHVSTADGRSGWLRVAQTAATPNHIYQDGEWKPVHEVLMGLHYNNPVCP